MKLVVLEQVDAELFGAERVYCHLFFELGDGGALAFFKFAKAEDEELFGPKMPASPFHHIALNVDADSLTGAVGVYTRNGFVATDREVSYAKVFPAV